MIIIIIIIVFIYFSDQSKPNMSVQGFQQVLQGPFANYLQASSHIGGVVAEHAKIVHEAFQSV